GRGAEGQGGCERRHYGLGKPVGEVLGAVDGELEILLSIDLIEPIDRRREERGADRGVLERQRNVGCFVKSAARSYPAVPHLEPAPRLLVARLDLRHQVTLPQAKAEFLVPTRLQLH